MWDHGSFFLLPFITRALAGHEHILKGPDGELVAHTADVIGHGAVTALLIGQLQIEVGHLVDVGQVVFVQFREDLFHFLLFALGGAVIVDIGIHEILQRKEGFLFLRAHGHIAVAVGEDALDHGRDALGFRFAQHGGAFSGQDRRVQHPGTDGILDVVVDERDLVRHPDDAASGVAAQVPWYG